MSPANWTIEQFKAPSQPRDIFVEEKRGGRGGGGVVEQQRPPALSRCL